MNAPIATPQVQQVEFWRQGWPITFDFETHLIQPARQLPPAVCMSWTEIVPNAATVSGMAPGPCGVVTALDGIAMLEYWLENGATIVGANTAFDVLVSVVKAPDYMRLLRLWVAAYESGRVRDVFTRQKLLDIAAGCYRGEDLPNGKWLQHNYNLKDLCERHTRRVLSKPADEDDHDHWRLRFGELEGVPVAQYPKEAYDYALEDSIGTAEVFIAQEVKRTKDNRIKRHFAGRDPFADEIRQTMACLPLKAMSAYGLRTDGPSVERLAEEVEAKIIETREDLVAEGLVRPPQYEKNTEAVVDYIKTRGLLQYFEEAGQILLHKARFVDAWRATNDVNMWRLANYRELSKDRAAYWVHFEELIALGIVEVKHTRDTKAAMERCVRAYEAEGLKAPRTDSYDPEKSGPYEHVSLDADSCSGSGDLMLEQYSAYTSLAKTVSNDLPMLRSGILMPVHTRYDELIKTGRTSSSKPNVQNVRRLPGIRECFVPREGFVFIDTDFGMLELHTLAQVCYWVLGFSTLGDALNAGKDPHLIIASAILSIHYDLAKARKEAGDPEVDNARTGGKGLNFGAAGGLSAPTFVIYAWTNYKIRLTLERAQELLKIYHDTWKEIPAYFKWVKSHKDPYSVRKYVDKKTKQERETCSYNIVQPWSNRLRAGAAYCEACNSPFQGLGADVAKLALWLVWKATMGLSELGEADPLYGCRMVNFVHDSIMTEVQRARAHAAAMRQKELMELAGKIVLPTVPVKSDALVCEQWSKKAQQWREPCSACGVKTKCKCGTWAERKLIPWDLRIACRESLEAFAAKSGDDQIDIVAEMRVGKDKWKAMSLQEQANLLQAVGTLEPRERCFEYLKKKEWPRDVSREAVANMFGQAEKVAA